MLYTAKTVRVQAGEKESIIGLGTAQECIPTRDADRYVAILEYCLTGATQGELNNFLQVHQFSYDDISWLLKHNFLLEFKKDLSGHSSRLEKNLLYYDMLYGHGIEVMESCSDYSIVLAGCGGIGNFLGFALGALPLKSLIMIDGDKVESSNLNRQFLFSEFDIGEPKVSTLAREIRRRGAEFPIETYYEMASRVNLAKIVDSTLGKPLVVVSADSAGILEEATVALAPRGIPFLNVGYLNDISVIGPFFDSTHACPMCGNALANKRWDSGDRRIESYSRVNSRYSAPSIFTNNAFASAMAFNDIIAYMSGHFECVQSFNQRVGIDNVTFSRYNLPIEKEVDCEYCA